MNGVTDSLSLKALARETGSAIPTAANIPVDLNDPEYIWYVERGAVDVFRMERSEGQDIAAPRHMIHAEAGRMLMGVAPQTDEPGLGRIAKGLPGTVLRRLTATALNDIDAADAAEQVDAWIAGVSATLFERNDLPASGDVLVEPGGIVGEAHGTLRSLSGVVWVPDDGLYMGIAEASSVAPTTADKLVPLTPDTWLTLFGTTRIACRSTESLARAGILLELLDRFHAVAFAARRIDRLLMLADDANLQRERERLRSSDEQSARLGLYELLGRNGETAARSELSSVLDLIGRHEGIDFRKPNRKPREESAGLTAILDISGVRSRRIRLKPEERWWHGDCGAILGFRAAGGRPVALLPGMLGGYREVDATGQRGVRVTAERARALAPVGIMFYRPLPEGRAGAADLLRLVRNSLGSSVARFGATALLGGLVTLAPAAVIGVITDAIIPANEAARLYQAIAALVGFAVLGALLRIVEGTSLMRIEGRVAARVEAALWDRLLRLPTAFMRRLSAGDIATRGMTVQAVRDSVSGVVASALVSVGFSLPAFALMLHSDVALGAVGTVMGLLSLIAVVVFGLRQIPHYRRILASQRRVAGRLFQFIEGIPKVRACSVERTAFAQWARQYRAQKGAELRLRNLNAHLLATSTGMPGLAVAAMLVAAEPEAVSAGDFLVVIVAFGIFQAALLRFGASISALAAVIPAYEQLRPILREVPESSATGASIEGLGGEIALDHVSFRYDADGPKVVDDVSVRVRPGEFVAVTGVSGSGKSTLLRLALGLETPSSGSVYYDGQELSGLNLKQLRRKIGIVLQETTLMPEDIRDNIAADDNLAVDASVWKAARLSAVDKEIAKMPMGMFTGVGKSTATLSGGEVQRVAIASALYGDPRVVMLDEATNWLDNEKQAQVMRNIEGLACSKLVIAHRLSTLRRADRIYVLQGGRIVQHGNYEALMACPGAFRDLVHRQLP